MATKKTKTTTKAAPAKKPAAKKPAVATKKAVAGKSTAVAKKPVAKKPTVAAKTAPKKAAAKKPVGKEPGTAAKSAPTAKTKGRRTRADGKSTPAGKPGAKEAPVGETSVPPVARTRKVSAFSIGDKVVHPQHGAAIIVKKVKQTVAGNRQDYFKLEIATDQLTVFVPVASIEETIRPVISKNQARKVFALFKEPPQEAGSNWSRWYKVLNEKMTSGDIYQVAEVVRDLTYSQQTKGISPALKRMLSKARLTLTSELRFALNVDEEEATRKLDRALPSVEPLDES